MKKQILKTVLKSSALTLSLTQALLAANPSEILNSHIGKGILHYDKDAGLKDRCIQLTNDQVFEEQTRITEYKLEIVNNKEELYDKISISGAAGGSYGPFSAKAKSTFVREIKWNYNSNYVLVRALRITKKQNISANKVLLDNQSVNLLEQSRFKFLESCGSSFANTVHLGGEIFGVIEIVSDTFEKKTQIKNSLSGSGKFGASSGSASFSYERTLKELSHEYKLNLNFKHIGGEQIAMPNTIDELLEVSKKIETIADKKPVAIAIETRDYTTLSNFVLDTDKYQDELRQNNIDFVQRKLDVTRNMYAQIAYILENPRDFKSFNETELKKQLAYLDNKILELKEFVIKSYRFLNQVEDIDQIEVNLDFEIPQMRNMAERRVDKKGLKVTCETKKSEFCGVEKYKEQKSSACGVIGVNTGTGPTCGTVYKEAESQYCGVKKYNVARAELCGAERYNQCHHKDCGKNWDGSRKRCRTSACGVEVYKACENPKFGVAEYNKCRDEKHGIEKYNTCAHKDFGYNFETCEHLSHGPETYKSCEVANIGNQDTYCPKF